MQNPFILTEAKPPRLGAEDALEVAKTLRDMGRLSTQQYVDAVTKIKQILAGCNELRNTKYQDKENPLAGHCYVASETLYHLLGGLDQKQWVAANVRHEGDSHWFLKNRESGAVLDPTASQFSTPVPYEQGVPKGFLTRQPSHRSMVVLKKFFESLEPFEALLEERAVLRSVSTDLVKELQGRNPLTDTDYDWLLDTADWALNWSSMLSSPKEQRLQKEARAALLQNPKFPFSSRLFELMADNLEAFVFGRPGVKELVRSPGFWQSLEMMQGLGWGKMSEMVSDNLELRALLFGKPVKAWMFTEEIKKRKFVQQQHTATRVKQAFNPLTNQNTMQIALPLKVMETETGVVAVLPQPFHQSHSLVDLYPSLNYYLRKMLGMTRETFVEMADPQ